MIQHATWSPAQPLARALLRGLAVFAALAALAPSTAWADGIDLWWYFSRVPGWSDAPAQAALLMCGLMVLNYGLNFLVIGWPAVHMGALLPRVCVDLVWLTLLGQVADRVGAVAGPLLVGLGSLPFNLQGEKGLGIVVSGGILLNFILTGVAIALLARHFLRRRWSLSGRRVWVVAVAAGLLTNPTWAIGLGLL